MIFFVGGVIYENKFIFSFNLCIIVIGDFIDFLCVIEVLIVVIVGESCFVVVVGNIDLGGCIFVDC